MITIKGALDIYLTSCARIYRFRDSRGPYPDSGTGSPGSPGLFPVGPGPDLGVPEACQIDGSRQSDVQNALDRYHWLKWSQRAPLERRHDGARRRAAKHATPRAPFATTSSDQDDPWRHRSGTDAFLYLLNCMSRPDDIISKTFALRLRAPHSRRIRRATGCAISSSSAVRAAVRPRQSRRCPPVHPAGAAPGPHTVHTGQGQTA